MNEIIVLTREQYQADLLLVAKEAALLALREFHYNSPEQLMTMAEIMERLKWGRQKLRMYRKNNLIKPAAMSGNNKLYTLSQFTTVPKN